MDATVDVGGELRRTPQFPRVEDFPLAGRATVAASSAFDHAFRTWSSSLVAASMLPKVAHLGRIKSDLASLRFYDRLREAQDVERVFADPGEPDGVEVVRREPLRWRWLPGTLDLLRAPSPFVPVNPAIRAEYGSHEPNRTAWAQHWRHDDGARPTVLVVHGFMASTYYLNRLFFSLPWWYSNGYDLLLVTLPFHGPRGRPSVLNGTGLFTNGPAHTVEGVLQSMADLRMWMRHLRSQGVEQIGATGVSLGGFSSALLAAVEPSLHFSIPNVPVAHLDDTGSEWWPSSSIQERLYGALGSDAGTVRDALSLVSPLSWPVQLDRERLFVIAGLGDRLAPPEQAELLWEHWGRPAIHAFPGNHVLHVERGAYLRRIGRFIRSTGFGV